MRCLLLIDPGGRVIVGDLDSGARFAFDDLPTAGGAGGRTPARTAAWSRTGQWTAWALDDEDPDGTRELRLHVEDTESNQVLLRGVSAFYLCPSPCGRYLSHLSPGPLGLELTVSDIGTGELRIIERGQPLFSAWSPDATQLAVHVGDRVLIAPADGGAPVVLSEDAGRFITPWWTPHGTVIFADGEQLVSARPDGEITPLGVPAGAGRFCLDPDGRRIALLHAEEDRTALVIVDLLTGERTTVTTEPTAAFFWSPDARRLAAVVPAGPSELQWIVHDGESVRRLAPFRPSVTWLRDVLPFFEQYAQSHAVWSADSCRLVAPAVDSAGSTQAVVHTVDGPPIIEYLSGARLAWWAD